MDITVLDVETANADYASLCQVGLVRVVNGRIVEEVGYLIDPQAPFHDTNICIHGIGPETVAGHPTFAALWPYLADHFGRQYVASYGPFDRTAVTRALGRCGLPPVATPWLDVLRLVRRVWLDEFGGGYGLANTCQELGVSMGKHHDAVADARAAAEILLVALDHANMTIDQAMARALAPMRQHYRPPHKRRVGTTP